MSTCVTTTAWSGISPINMSSKISALRSPINSPPSTMAITSFPSSKAFFKSSKLWSKLFSIVKPTVSSVFPTSPIRVPPSLNQCFFFANSTNSSATNLIPLLLRINSSHRSPQAEPEPSSLAAKAPSGKRFRLPSFMIRSTSLSISAASQSKLASIGFTCASLSTFICKRASAEPSRNLAISSSLKPSTSAVFRGTCTSSCFSKPSPYTDTCQGLAVFLSFSSLSFFL